MRFTSRPRPTLKSIAAALALAVSIPLSAAEEQTALPLDELRTFAEVFNQIRTGYVEEIDDSTLLEFAIEGMLMGLDPHSMYLTQDAYQGLQDSTSGEFTGLGLEVDDIVVVWFVESVERSKYVLAGVQSGTKRTEAPDPPTGRKTLHDS